MGENRAAGASAVALGPRGRKLALVAHVGSSVGWLGAVVTSLILAVVALASTDAQVVRAVYLVLKPLGWYTLIPFSLAGLVTGLISRSARHGGCSATTGSWRSY